MIACVVAKFRYFYRSVTAASNSVRDWFDGSSSFEELVFLYAALQWDASACGESLAGDLPETFAPCWLLKPIRSSLNTIFWAPSLMQTTFPLCGCTNGRLTGTCRGETWVSWSWSSHVVGKGEALPR